MLRIGDIPIDISPIKLICMPYRVVDPFHVLYMGLIKPVRTPWLFNLSSSISKGVLFTSQAICFVWEQFFIIS